MAASEPSLRLPLLRPDVIAFQRFLIDKRGFDVEEVEAYLRTIAEGVRLLQDQLEVERARADDLRRDAEQAQQAAYTKLTRELGEAIKAADESASRALADAERQARLTLAGAQERAEAIVAQAKRMGQEILSQAREASAAALAEAPVPAGDANGMPQVAGGARATAESARLSPTGGHVEAPRAVPVKASQRMKPDPANLEAIRSSIWGPSDSPRQASEANAGERGGRGSAEDPSGGTSANGANAANRANGRNAARHARPNIVELTAPSDPIDLADLELNLSGSLSDLFEDHEQ